LSKVCGCLVGIILGFLFAVAVALLIACTVFKSKPEDVINFCTRRLQKVTIKVENSAGYMDHLKLSGMQE